MKKIFGLSITRRKEIDIETWLTAKACSANGDELGIIKFKFLDEKENGGIFFNYTPLTSSDCNDCVTYLQFEGNTVQVERKLQYLLKNIQEVVSKDSYIMAYIYIRPESRTIIIPAKLEFITHSLMCKAGNDWIGLEIAMSTGLKQVVHELAEEKRKQSELPKND